MIAFNKILLPFDDTGYFSNIVLDYLSRNKKLKDFYNYFPELSSFKQAIQDKKRQTINRKLLVEVLQDQNNSSPTLPLAGGEVEPSRKSSISGIKYREYKKVLHNINALKNENTFTVTTGHQLCLFMGPLYFIYKIISTINLTEELKKAYPDYIFVPLYWMASEDHDFDEVNHIHIFGKTLTTPLSPCLPDGQARTAAGPVGRISTNSLEPVLKELKTILGDSENARELYDLFQKTYLGHSSLSNATRYLVNELFGQYGLVIIDGDDKRLKNEFSSVIEDDIFNNTAFQLVNSTNKKLSKHYKIQVNPREINVFYLRNHLRERIIKSPLEGGSPDSCLPAGEVSGQGDVSPLEASKGGVFSVMNTDISFTGQELIKELKTHPERFSPNVVLRPLYQEKILPNLAMIGGGAELAYWLQLKSVFDHYKVRFPVLVLRDSVMLIDKNTKIRLNKLGIQPVQLFNNTDRLIKGYLNRTSKTRLSLDSEKKKITGVFKDIILKSEKTDNSLKAAVESELQKQLKGLAAIESKLLKAEKKKQETNVSQIRNIKEKLFPGDVLQERYNNFIPYFLKYGKEFIAELKRGLNPLESSFIIFEEK